jgi:hypothetical protein
MDDSYLLADGALQYSINLKVMWIEGLGFGRVVVEGERLFARE